MTLTLSLITNYEDGDDALISYTCIHVVQIWPTMGVTVTERRPLEIELDSKAALSSYCKALRRHFSLPSIQFQFIQYDSVYKV